MKKRGWVPGPEDRHWAPLYDNLWTASEYPGKRWVFAVNADRTRAGEQVGPLAGGRAA